jgi:putative metalloprotease
MLLSSCEDTNILLLTDAASDAVTAFTLSDEQVGDLARRAASAADSQHRVAPPGSSHDTRLRRLLAGSSGSMRNGFNVKVYKTKDVNAFAMADGTIRVNSGLMDLMNDEELLFVIGHEMGHVVKEHSRKKLVLAYASSALRKGLAAQGNEVGLIAGSVLGAFAEQLTNAQFSQHEERQADQYGVDFLEAGGYDRYAAVTALEKLAGLASRHTFLSSHPDPEARIKKLALQGGDENEPRDSLVGRVLSFAKALALKILQLAVVLVKWLLSLW